MPLTDLKIRSLAPSDKVYSRADEHGLMLEVHPNGSKLWRFKFRHLGKQKRVALGRYPIIGLAEARKRRDEERRKLESGVDPVLERHRAKLSAYIKSANTFGAIAKEYIDKLVADGSSEATIVKTNWLLRHLEPLAPIAIMDLKPVDILGALRRVEAHGRYETAQRCRSFASRVFRYAVATGRAEVDPTSVLRGALVTPKVTHRAAIIDPGEVGEMLRAIDAYSGNKVTRTALQIAPQVMTRPGELRRAQWSEFNLDNAIWKVPEDRMKMRRPHSVPLSRQVLELLAELHSLTGPVGYVFPAFHTTRRPLSENTMNQAFRRMGYASGEVSAHGLRTTASTLLNESGMWNPDAIERSLAHTDKDSIRGIYNRGRYWEERVKMHQWWSDYLDKLRDGDTNAPMGHNSRKMHLSRS